MLLTGGLLLCVICVFTKADQICDMNTVFQDKKGPQTKWQDDKDPSTAEECKQFCLSTSACKASELQSGNRCVIYHEQPALSAEAGTTHWRKTCREETVAFKKVCYYTNWGQYRPSDGKFTPEKIDPFLCSHIIYAFAQINNNNDGITNFEWNDEDMYRKVIALKTENPALKVLLAVGGFNQGGTRFVPMSSTDAGIDTFADNAATYLRQRNFDGLDIDWEFPNLNNKERYTVLLQRLRAKFEEEATRTGNKRLLLVAAVPASEYNLKGYDMDKIHIPLDFLNVMTYDFRGPWNSKVGHHSALYRYPTDIENLNMDWSIKHWMSKGAPKEKLILGLATHARSFVLADGTKNKPGSPSSVTSLPTPGNYTKTPGILTYYEVCDITAETGWQTSWISESQVPYAYGLRKGLKWEWIGYDNTVSFTAKLNYVKNEGLGGAMVWSLAMDDFDGLHCGHGKRYPLISLMKEILCPKTETTSPQITSPTTSPTSTSLTTQTTSSTTSPVTSTPPTSPPTPPPTMSTTQTTSETFMSTSRATFPSTPPPTMSTTQTTSETFMSTSRATFPSTSPPTMSTTQTTSETFMSTSRATFPSTSPPTSSTTPPTTSPTKQPTSQTFPSTSQATSTTSLTTSPTTTPTFSKLDTWKDECKQGDRHGDFFRQPDDCSIFYVCSNGHSYHFQCPSILVFDINISNCNWPWNVSC